MKAPWDGFRVDKISFGGGAVGAVVSICGVLTLVDGVPVLRWPVLLATVVGVLFGIGLIVRRQHQPPTGRRDTPMHFPRE